MAAGSGERTVTARPPPRCLVCALKHRGFGVRLSAIELAAIERVGNIETAADCRRPVVGAVLLPRRGGFLPAWRCPWAVVKPAPIRFAALTGRSGGITPGPPCAAPRGYLVCPRLDATLSRGYSLK
jgi:hypothetical protein